MSIGFSNRSARVLGRLKAVCIALVLLSGYWTCCTASIGSAQGTRLRRQPLHLFDTSFKEIWDGAIDLNPFRFYTNFGTDYGRMGPGEDEIDWIDGVVIAPASFDWKGMWFSLNGLAVESDQLLNFLKCYPSFIKSEFQPKCVAVSVRAKGNGILKLEIKSETNELLWMKILSLNSDEFRYFRRSFDPAAIGKAKFFNWVAEAGTHAEIDSIELIFEFPALPRDWYFFLYSYAKLAKCYSHTTGICKDRAHWPLGDFDSVPASGLFCMVTASAADLGIVRQEFARTVLRRTYKRISALPRAHGLLPHFVRREQGEYTIVPGTEFSSVDTGLYYLAMLNATETLQDQWVLPQLLADILSIDFEHFTAGNGRISHGYPASAPNHPLPSGWFDFGGETAIVLILEQIVRGSEARGQMDDSGAVFKGRGFIAEIQSLFFEDFNSAIPDAVAGVNWLAMRRQLFRDQIQFFRDQDTVAGLFGFYGLSAGEGPNGVGYISNGTEEIQAEIVHPHYMLMSSSVRTVLPNVYDMMTRLEFMGLFPPFGLVENFGFDLGSPLPMIGSLNASFEAISAYHLLARNRQFPDAIYDSSLSNLFLRDGVGRFYPK